MEAEVRFPNWVARGDARLTRTLLQKRPIPLQTIPIFSNFSFFKKIFNYSVQSFTLLEKCGKKLKRPTDGVGVSFQLLFAGSTLSMNFLFDFKFYQFKFASYLKLFILKLILKSFNLKVLILKKF